MRIPAALLLAALVVTGCTAIDRPLQQDWPSGLPYPTPSDPLQRSHVGLLMGFLDCNWPDIRPAVPYEVADARVRAVGDAASAEFQRRVVAQHSGPPPTDDERDRAQVDEIHSLESMAAAIRKKYRCDQLEGWARAVMKPYYE